MLNKTLKLYLFVENLLCIATLIILNNYKITVNTLSYKNEYPDYVLTANSFRLSIDTISIFISCTVLGFNLLVLCYNLFHSAFQIDYKTRSELNLLLLVNLSMDFIRLFASTIIETNAVVLTYSSTSGELSMNKSMFSFFTILLILLFLVLSDIVISGYFSFRNKSVATHFGSQFIKTLLLLYMPFKFKSFFNTIWLFKPNLHINFSRIIDFCTIATFLYIGSILIYSLSQNQYFLKKLNTYTKRKGIEISNPFLLMVLMMGVVLFTGYMISLVVKSEFPMDLGYTIDFLFLVTLGIILKLITNPIFKRLNQIRHLYHFSTRIVSVLFLILIIFQLNLCYTGIMRVTDPNKAHMGIFFDTTNIQNMTISGSISFDNNLQFFDISPYPVIRFQINSLVVMRVNSTNSFTILQCLNISSIEIYTLNLPISDNKIVLYYNFNQHPIINIHLEKSYSFTGGETLSIGYNATSYCYLSAIPSNLQVDQ